jgi:hypothetical protein
MLSRSEAAFALTKKCSAWSDRLTRIASHLQRLSVKPGVLEAAVETDREIVPMLEQR